MTTNLHKLKTKKDVTAFKLAILPTVLTVLLSNSYQANAAVIEQIQVTANKRSQNMQDVGVSVTAFSGDQMKALGVTNTTEITQQIPGLQVNAWSPTITTFNLRGISQNNFTDNLEAPVAVYTDNVYIGSMNAISGQLFDVNRVEVLRGPQGTLFGRNATGGLIHYVTNDASNADFNGYVEASYSDFNKRILEGAVGGSFSDTARFRFAGRMEKADGYVEARDQGVIYELSEGNEGTANLARDLQSADGISLRTAFQFDLTDDLILDLNLKYSKDNDVATGGYVPIDTLDDPETGLGLGPTEGSPVTGKPWEHTSNTEGFFEREAISGTASLTWYMESGIEFSSITNYSTMDKDYLEDGDGIDLDLITFQNTVEPFTQFSQEFRFSGENENVRWQAGLYYLDMDLELEQSTSGGAFFPTATAGRSVKTVQESKNWSVFGQFEYDFADDFTLITGLRWSQDDKKIDLTNTYFDPSLSPAELEAATVANSGNITNLDDALNAIDGRDASYSEIDYGDYALRIQLDYKYDSSTLMYVSYNRGIKGGNWSPSQDVKPGAPELTNLRHDEEVLHSYEFGLKTAFWDDIARINTSIYYYDYEDYQSFSFTNFVPAVANKDASAQGLEVELFLTPGESWDILLGMALSDSEVKGVNTAMPGVTVDAELPSAPKYSFNFLVRKSWDIGQDELAAQFDGAIYGEQFLEGHNSVASTEDAYSVWNASVSYKMDNLDFSLWVKNLTNKEFRVYNLDFGALGSTAMYAPPRWVGLTASYKW